MPDAWQMAGNAKSVGEYGEIKSRVRFRRRAVLREVAHDAVVREVWPRSRTENTGAVAVGSSTSIGVPRAASQAFALYSRIFVAVQRVAENGHQVDRVGGADAEPRAVRLGCVYRAFCLCGDHG